jgi:hypothetical protein
MSLQTSTGKATKMQVKRFEAIKESGCICCRLSSVAPQYPEIHHLLSGGRRRGHDETIGLCAWHHRGVKPDYYQTKREVRALMGPSLAEGSKPFHAEYGSDDQLLQIQNELIGCGNERVAA